MKVIFLDIDGVLIPYGQDARTLSPTCMAHLQDIVKETDAKLVISSSWRVALFDRLMTMLDAYGLRECVIGMTAHGLPLPAGVLACDSVAGSRPREIKAWLDAHPDVTRYVVLDDERMSRVACVTTASYVGLTAQHRDAAIARLNAVT